MGFVFENIPVFKPSVLGAMSWVVPLDISVKEPSDKDEKL
jgi:hypothetical protein